MVISDRLRQIREAKNFSQGDIEKKTGLLRCYISRIENGHTLPAMGTLEKLARALGVPLYLFFYDGEKPPEVPDLQKRKPAMDIAWGSSGKQGRYLHKLTKCLSKLTVEHRNLLLALAKKLAARNRARSAAPSKNNERKH